LVRERERAREKEREREMRAEPELVDERADIAAPTSPPTPKPADVTLSHKEQKGTFEELFSFWRAPSSTSKPPNSTSPFRTETALAEERSPVASGEFDLEPYGFDLVLDFRWTRQPS